MIIDERVWFAPERVKIGLFHPENAAFPSIFRVQPQTGKGCQMDWRVILTVAVTGLAIILESLSNDDE